MKIIKNNEHEQYDKDTKKQMAKINNLSYSIKFTQNKNPEKALKFLKELDEYVNKLISKKKASPTIAKWIKQNTPKIEQEKRKLAATMNKIKVKEAIAKLIDKADLAPIYEKYTGKEHFIRLVEEALQKVDKQIEVKSGDAGNNPLAIVNHQKGDAFVLRILRMNSAEVAAHVSPMQLREKLGNKISQVPQPIRIMQVAKDDGMECTYFEVSEYYKQGNLKEHFVALREQRNEGTLSDAEFNQQLFHYAEKIVSLFANLNKNKVWYTDLKPTNLLLNDRDIVVSDIKGLVSSEATFTQSNRTSSTDSYYQSNLETNGKFDLDLLQCQTLAVTLYEMACGGLPEATRSSRGYRELSFDFNKPVFDGSGGQFLKRTITQLMTMQPPEPDVLLKQIREFNKTIHSLSLDTETSSSKSVSSDMSSSDDYPELRII